MSKRMDRIYAYLCEQNNEEGLTTTEIAQEFSIQRSNVSKDLNELVRLGKVKKIAGRPVRYINKGKKSLMNDLKIDEQTTFEKSASEKDINIFSDLIGASGSMKNACEQAQAAILYPPKGLNCLITGPTGSGKTFFAHMMFRFAQEKQVVQKNKELIIFNCADYAHNPELLMSHLFGFSKGAFTGAVEEKSGLLEQADGSVLFLDEIHRLPPEGQEMIFYFMDNGTYHRLGEADKKRKSNVRIIGATTEDPHSSLLATFVRRIPIHIQLPAFIERSPKEKVELTIMMIAQEARSIQRVISATEDVVKALIGSVNFGNVGQLKSNVQLICARGFLNHMEQPQIDLTLNDLPDSVREGLVNLGNDRKQMSELTKYLQPQFIIEPDAHTFTVQTDTYELPYNLYSIIGDKAALLKADGIDQVAINQFIATDITVHLKSFYKNHGFSFETVNKLSEFLTEEMVHLTKELVALVESRCAIVVQRNFVYAIGLHVSSLIKKIRLGEQRFMNENIQQMVQDYPLELAVAQEMHTMICQYCAVELPEDEIDCLAALLISLRNSPQIGKIGVVVATHGESTATSMVNVVSRLLKVTHLRAVDMPLSMAPQKAFEQIEQAVLEVDEGNGVLLLVDMGSLTTFTAELIKKTNIQVETVDLVSTPLVLEATRKGAIIDADLATLAASLRTFHGFNAINHLISDNKSKAIVAICASGMGTAQRMKEMIEQFLQAKKITGYVVLTSSITEIEQKIKVFEKEYQIVGVTGLIDPQLKYPYISIDQLIERNDNELLSLIALGSEFYTAATENERVETDFTAEEYIICQQFIGEHYTFLNPAKVVQPLAVFTQKILKIFPFLTKKITFQHFFMIHMAGVLERVVINQPLSADQLLINEILNDPDYIIFHEKTTEFFEQFQLKIPVSEEVYLLEWLRQYSEK